MSERARRILVAQGVAVPESAPARVDPAEARARLRALRAAWEAVSDAHIKLLHVETALETHDAQAKLIQANDWLRLQLELSAVLLTGHDTEANLVGSSDLYVSIPEEDIQHAVD